MASRYPVLLAIVAFIALFDRMDPQNTRGMFTVLGEAPVIENLQYSWPLFMMQTAITGLSGNSLEMWNGQARTSFSFLQGNTFWVTLR